jgi:hypothetical protein
VYSVMSALHAKGRNPVPQTNTKLGFHYFTADAPTGGAASQPPGQLGMDLDNEEPQVCILHWLWPCCVTLLPFIDVVCRADGLPFMIATQQQLLMCSMHSWMAGATVHVLRYVHCCACCLLQGNGSAGTRVEPVIPVGSKYQGLTMQRLASLFYINDTGGCNLPAR